ncbi:hypothetical protein [Gemmiger formicilis]|uniref:hypothetical protein n=1 Tax=Gemmiger formicilis TaxID=745368 RepID=UPI0035209F25
MKELVCPQGNLTSTKVEKRLEQLNAEIEAQGIEVKKGRGHHKPEIVRERDELALLYRRWMEYNSKEGDLRGESQQLFQDRHRCHFYAYERRPYAQWPAKARI